MSKRRRRAEWIAVCEALEGSGETTRAFAERRGVHQATLGWWLTKLRRERAIGGRAKAFVEVVSAAPASVAGAVVQDPGPRFAKKHEPTGVPGQPAREREAARSGSAGASA